ncbi:hypothetical protein [Streptomyces sp. NBC_01296]|uniref:hypothetical protein n=1 Tax=Streptomyces sp. NBC_01296 TaxID=2903816 RepID=UPI002E0D2C78|nr:hypothetical protein OG299_01570 [Streptomyces sp. NBC_01296]
MTASGQPLVVPDARADDRSVPPPSLADLGLIVYAGMPLTDYDGLALDSLCAIGRRTRIPVTTSRHWPCVP